MIQMVYKVFYLFFLVLEMMLFAYVISSWIPNFKKTRGYLKELMEPVLTPLRYFLRHSILQNRVSDLSPVIALLVLSYLSSFFFNLLE